MTGCVVAGDEGGGIEGGGRSMAGEGEFEVREDGGKNGS